MYDISKKLNDARELRPVERNISQNSHREPKNESLRKPCTAKIPTNLINKTPTHRQRGGVVIVKYLCIQ
jgi:hypothetical protein